MPSIRSVGTALPKYEYRNSDILSAAKVWLANQPTEMALFERFVASAQTEKRFFIQPLDAILELGGMSKRSAMFEDVGVNLGAESLLKAVETAKLDPAEIDSFIFTSCSSPVIPSIDANIMERMNLSRSVNRLPIYQHGCAAGVIGLSLANRFAQSGEQVALTSVELCSLGFQFNDYTAGNLVGSAIFGDGSASVVVSPDNDGMVFVDSQSVLTKDSRHLMGYDLYDDGAHLRLNKELPGFLAKYVPPLTHTFLERNGMQAKDVKWWLFHPGGVKILNCLEQSFALDPEQAPWARTALREYGNLSSSSILFVTSEFLKSKAYKDRDRVMMVGVGPGLTVELILFEMRLPEGASTF